MLIETAGIVDTVLIETAGILDTVLIETAGILDTVLSKLYLEYRSLMPGAPFLRRGNQGSERTDCPRNLLLMAELAKPLDATRLPAHSLDAARPVNGFMAPSFKTHSSEVYYIIENKGSLVICFPLREFY